MKKCREEIIESRKTFLIGEADKLGVASENEIKNEIEYMIQTLNLLNCIWPKLRTVRETILSGNEIEQINSNIKQVQSHWCCKRQWEKKV